MSVTACLGETWDQLRSRLLAQDRLGDWAQLEPDLHGLSDPQEIRVIAADRDQPGRSDQVFAALLRLAATDGGDDRGAALLVAHLMAPGLSLVARSLRDLSPDIDWLVAASLWTQVRTYRWRDRTAGHARGLKLDTRAAVLREVGVDRGGRYRERPVGPLPIGGVRASVWPLTFAAAGTVGLGGGEVSEAERSWATVQLLLRWAQRHKVLSATEVHLLLSFDLGEPAERAELARQYGVTDRHLRRQCFRLKSRLRDAVANAPASLDDFANAERRAPAMSARRPVFTSGSDRRPLAR